MTNIIVPTEARIWQYAATRGGLENNLELNSCAVPQPSQDHHIIQVIATALNPVDYKPAEIPIIGRFLVPNPATPGCDIVGRIVTPAVQSSFLPGQLVFGIAGKSAFAAGGLAEYVSSPVTGIVALPPEVAPVDAATIGVAGLTAYQSIHPYVKSGDKVFLNGGSGGTGIFGIQIAKALGCYVAVTCSASNVELCKSLGADLVIDYSKTDVIAGLIQSGVKFDHVVDNVGSNKDLYWKCHQYTNPRAVYVYVAGSPSREDLIFNIKDAILPSILGGGKRKRLGLFAQIRRDELQRIVEWMNDGRVRAVIDSRFPFEQTPEAYRKLKSGRAKGKIIVDVDKQV